MNINCNKSPAGNNSSFSLVERWNLIFAYEWLYLFLWKILVLFLGTGQPSRMFGMSVIQYFLYLLIRLSLPIMYQSFLKLFNLLYFFPVLIFYLLPILFQLRQYYSICFLVLSNVFYRFAINLALNFGLFTQLSLPNVILVVYLF